MGESKFGGPLWFVISQLTEVVVKPFWSASVEARPESWFADGLATSENHRLVVVGGTTDHVTVWLNVAHGESF